MMLHTPDASTIREWDEILASVLPYSFDSPPRIAGGAVRDLLLGKPVSDIDVFHTGALAGGEMQAVLQEAYGGVVAIRTLPRYGHRVQFIQVVNVPSRIAHFSLNISEAWYSIETGLGVSSRFLEGARNRVLRFRAWASERYVRKITGKYAEYDTVRE